jgi:hypothetical protein
MISRETSRNIDPDPAVYGRSRGRNGILIDAESFEIWNEEED